MIFNISTEFVLIIFFTLLICVVSSLVLVATYYYTSKDSININYLKALILMPIVASMLMQSIGNSLALGFGIFGALAIIRFRTNIADLKDIAYVFCAMAIGITTGVNAFFVCIFGTMFFCILAIILNSRLAKPYIQMIDDDEATNNANTNEKQIKIRIIGINDDQKKQHIESVLEEFSLKFQLQKYRYIKGNELKDDTLNDTKDIFEHEYLLTCSDLNSIDVIKAKIEELSGIKLDRIFYEKK